MPDEPHVDLYSDGSCLGNPGPGGFAAIAVTQDNRTLATSVGGHRLTTNNRMEVKAAIVGLDTLVALTEDLAVVVWSDSQYLIGTMTKGWRRRTNHDLWDELDRAVAQFPRGVTFEWVRGHSGDLYNERCDKLANGAALGRGLPADVGYEQVRVPV